MDTSYLIVGLGNPGKGYQKTRHNIGFMILDALAGRYKTKFRKVKKGFSISSIDRNAINIRLLKPLTFMNLSGIAVAAGIQQYNIALSNVLIICDDINLKFGTLRMRSKGSDGGQKGLRSIISLLGTQVIPRLRIGIGNQFDSNAADFVLSQFNVIEQNELPLIVQSAADAVESFIYNGLEFTMSRFNRNYLEH